MSHLLKKNKNILFSIRIFFILFISFIFFKTIFSYDGNKIIYFLFSIISIYMIFFSFRKKSFFYENFFGVFLFLGFWLKFSIIYSYQLSFREGLKNNFLEKILPQNYDDALIASSVAILGFITIGYIREFFFNYPKKIDIKINTELYKKYRNFILISFLCLILAVCFSNSFLQIYQRGQVGQSYNFILNGFIKTSLLYFLTLCSAIILYCDILTYKKVFLTLILLAFFETFLSSVSMLSRGMIFNSFALIFGIYKLSNKINLNLNFLSFVKFSLILLIAFYVSVISVNNLRISKINNETLISQETMKNSSEKITKKSSDEEFNIVKKAKTFFDKSFYRFNYLLVFRWVGIDAMILVTRNKEILGIDLFKESLKEKFDQKSISFYESKFGIYEKDHYQSSNLRKGNTLPGLLAFLFFSGSHVFLYISIIFFCLIASILEYLMFKVSFNNLLASSLIGMVVAYRFAHFGYLPSNSYLLFGSIIIIILTLFIIKLMNDFYKNLKK